MTTATINHTDWSLYDEHGYLQQHGVEVQTIDDLVRINGTLHRRDTLIVTDDRIESTVGNWYLTR